MNELANENNVLASRMCQDRIRVRKRETEELLYDLTNEYCVVSGNLKKLKKAIEANPESVSDYHKSLWKEQASYMTSYKSVLADRIKDILENN